LRLDKFLKVSRIIKRRTLAKDFCDQKQVLVNGTTAKAGTVVKPGDFIEVNFGQRRLKARIIELRETVPARQAAELYELLEDYRLEE